MRQKFIVVLILTLLIFSLAQSGEQALYVVKKLKGEAQVRHGVKENWEKISPGDTLKPDDTILLNKSAYIEIESNGISFKSNGDIIINISDLRRLSKEELLLQLAFEEMKNAPEKKMEKINTKSTGIYGTDIAGQKTEFKTRANQSKLWVNGVKALFQNGFYETASIRAKSLMLKFDELKDNIELAIIIATSLEKLEIYGEAISEYNKILSISKDESLSQKIERKIQELKIKLTSMKE